MKNKKHFILFLLSLLLVIACIFPALSQRISFEQNHKTYVTALRLSGLCGLFDDVALPDVIAAYKDSGVRAAVITEKNQSFSETELSLAKNAGLDIGLMLCGGDEKGTSYAETLARTVQTYGVKYILLQAAEMQDDFPLPITPVLQNSDCILVVKEHESQLSNEHFAGYEACVESADGRLMRCFETWENPAQNLSSSSLPNSDLLYQQMFNSARDRNTEFILVNQITAGDRDAFSGAEDTQKAISKFCARMEKIGYSWQSTPSLAGYAPNHRLICAATGFLACLMLLVLINCILKTPDTVRSYVFLSLGIMLFGVTFLLPEKLLFLYPTAFSCVAPCFVFAVCAHLFEKKKNSTALYLLLPAVLLLLCFCTLVLSAMLSGPGYYLNDWVFRGVKLTLLFPVLFAVVFSFFFYKSSTAGSDKKSRGKRLYPVIVLLFLGVCALLLLYILRSGNHQISGLEYQIRGLLSELTAARPRTKELLFGWPCLALWIRCVQKNNSFFWKWGFSIGASVLFASVFNTFCHVFTDVTVSLLRTVYGLLFAVPFIVAALLLLRQFEKKLK